jgi:hypothetical protein
VTSGAFDAVRHLRAALEAHHRRGDVKIIEPGGTFDPDAPEALA